MILENIFHSILQIKGFGFFEISVIKKYSTKDTENSFESNFDTLKKYHFFCDRIYSNNDYKVHGPFLLEKLESKDFVVLDDEILTDIEAYILFASKGQQVHDLDKLKLLINEFTPSGLKWCYMTFNEGATVLDATGSWDERYWTNPYVFYRSYIGYYPLGACILKLYLD